MRVCVVTENLLPQLNGVPRTLVRSSATFRGAGMGVALHPDRRWPAELVHLVRPSRFLLLQDCTYRYAVLWRGTGRSKTFGPDGSTSTDRGRVAAWSTLRHVLTRTYQPFEFSPPTSTSPRRLTAWASPRGRFLAYLRGYTNRTLRDLCPQSPDHTWRSSGGSAP